jgi:hypothetical protein
MGIGRDSANFAKKGITNFVLGVAGIGLFVLILYFGYKFLTANYATHEYYSLMMLGLFVADFAFCIILGRYIEQVLLKGKY